MLFVDIAWFDVKIAVITE